jgi:hypothetical protein
MFSSDCINRIKCKTTIVSILFQEFIKIFSDGDYREKNQNHFTFLKKLRIFVHLSKLFFLR